MVRSANIAFLLLFSLTMNYYPLNAQDIPTNEVCTHPKIKTILFYRSGWDLSMPVIFTGEDETLEFRFDYLDKPEIDFGYSIHNCTYDWQLNDIPEHYYLEGFNDLPLNNFEPSRNTTKYFTHYKLTIPNDDIRLLKSGNYMLTIYDRNNPADILISRRFCIAEDKVKIVSAVKHMDEQRQELNLQVDISQLNATDPLSEIKIIILKNYCWNKIVPINQAPLLRDKVLFMDMPFQIVSDGDNEFRFFDTKSTRTVSEHVDQIDYRAPEFYFVLSSDELRQYSQYFKSADLNGRFFIEIPDANDRHLDSDYVMVEFTLNCAVPLGSDVYIYGALTNWSTSESNFMTYNAERQAYEKTLMLKQGYYNYVYATRDFNSELVQFDLTEGNHTETENDYLIFVYFRERTEDFDRLAGYSVVNSTGKAQENTENENK